MALTDVARRRLADIVALQPTKNAELQERWGVESGSEVHQYLEDVLSEYYYRDEDSLIRATPEAADLVDVAPGVEGDEDGHLIVRVPALERHLLSVLPEPSDGTMSVVAAFHAVRETFDDDLTVDDVRAALGALRRKGAVETTYRIVPTYALSRPREEIRAEALAAEA